MGPKSLLQRHPHRNGMVSLMDLGVYQMALVDSWTLEKPSRSELTKVARTMDAGAK